MNFYKLQNQKKWNLIANHECELYFLNDKEDINRFNNYINTLQNYIPRIIQSFLNGNFDDYKEFCSLLALFISSMPNEIIDTPDFIKFVEFICSVLHNYQTLNNDDSNIHEANNLSYDILYSTLSILPPLLAKQSNNVFVFLIKHYLMEVIEKLLYFCISDTNNIENHQNMILLILSILRNIVINTPQGIENEFISSVLSYDSLKQVLDSFQTNDIREEVSKLCSTVLQYWPSDYIHRDELITIGFLTFKPEAGNDTSFILSLSKIFKARPNDIYEVLQTTTLNIPPSNFDDNEIPLFHILYNWINCQSSNVQYCVMKLFTILLKYVTNHRLEILGYINYEKIVEISQSNDYMLKSYAYKLLSYIIIVRSNIIRLLFEKGIVSNFEKNLQDGEFLLQKATLQLIQSIIKYGSMFQETSYFYCSSFIDQISTFFFSDQENLIQNTLEIIHLIASKANISNNTDVIQAINSTSFIESINSISVINDKISLYIEFIKADASQHTSTIQ